MDRLLANQSLLADQELRSSYAGGDGWFRFMVARDGSMAIYRVQTRKTVWAVPGLPHAGGRLVMQGDGNLVAVAPDGTPYWDSGTFGHPGAFAVMQNDGNLVVYDPHNRPLWASNTVQDLQSPTVRYTESPGYAFNETSESWKEMCRQLPCFLALQWPGYASGKVEDKIDGQDVVIQWWKGWCPKFLGFLGVQSFPGGVGAEVGVYRRIPGKVRPTALPFLPKPLETLVLDALKHVADEDLWWPFPELGAEVEFTLTNPVNGNRFFSGGPEKSYWMAKWMDDASYANYQRAQGPLQWPWLPPGVPGNARTPGNWQDYVLQFKVNGRLYDSIPPGPRPPYSETKGEVACVSRAPDKLDIFMVDASGVLRSAAWEPAFADGWHGWWPIGTARFPAGAPVSAVSRSRDKLDIFATDSAGVVRTAAWQPAFADGWHGWWEIAGGRAVPGAPVSCVSRSADKLDVFVVAAGGIVKTAAWQPGFADGWHGWWPIGTARFPEGAPVSCVSRSADKLDIFATDTAGVVRSAAWEPGFADGWHGWWEIAGGRAAPGAAVTAVSRGPDKLDIFVVGTDGRVWTAAWDAAVPGGWRGWSAIGQVQFPQGAVIHAVSRSAGKLDIFGTDLTGVVRTAAWEPGFADGWHGWWEVAGGRAQPGAPVSGAVRSANKMDVFAVGVDARVATAAWAADQAGGWHGWWKVR